MIFSITNSTLFSLYLIELTVALDTISLTDTELTGSPILPFFFPPLVKFSSSSPLSAGCSLEVVLFSHDASPLPTSLFLKLLKYI